jgi:hypothetical protein
MQPRREGRRDRRELGTPRCHLACGVGPTLIASGTVYGHIFSEDYFAHSLNAELCTSARFKNLNTQT